MSKTWCFKQTSYSHLKDCECPKCKSSKGEIKVRNYLKEKNILFEEQKKFKKLGRLSYDFYLPKKNLLIEFNGEQHYKQKDFFGGRKAFLLQKHHDWLKRKFAKENGFSLLVIKFDEDIKDKLKLII